MTDNENQVQQSSTPNPTTSSGPLTVASAAAGPLVVSETNPRYFTITSGESADRRAVYLTGSHIWNNLQDHVSPIADAAQTPQLLDYHAYLAFLKEHGHNFIRLWRWEHFKSHAFSMAPQPWPRTGPGTATDGQPKFDLSRFDQAYFDRLHERVSAAGNAGIYVAVMLFDGFGLHLSPPPLNVEGHPFHAVNNINGIGITSIVDYQVLPLDPAVQALQEAYLRKVVDTVADLPNILFEVANESSGEDAESVRLPDGKSLPVRVGDSTTWQYWVIDFVKRYEQQMGYDQHPVGMTMQYPVPDQSKVNDRLFKSRADWISPGFDDGVVPDLPGKAEPRGRWLTNPPANDGTKVVISDTDHYAPGLGDALWAWKSFLRGHHPILMDFGIIDVVHPDESFEPARYAMGDTLRYAQRMKLIDMEPRGELSSTGYMLANPGEEYLILQPGDTADPFTVTLEAGTYTAQWYSVKSREKANASTVTVESKRGTSFLAPFAEVGPTVLYLKQVGP